MATPFEICCDAHEVVTEIDLGGDFDRSAARMLSGALAAVRLSGAKMVVVDLRALTSIDATALASLRSADADCRMRGVRLRLLVPGRDGYVAVQGASEARSLDELASFTRESPVSTQTIAVC